MSVFNIKTCLTVAPLSKTDKAPKNTEWQYGYDANGNLKFDFNKGITGIWYNHLNLPSFVYFSDGRQITFNYTADGELLRKQTYNPIDNTSYWMEYVNGMEYKNWSLNRLPHSEGAVIRNDAGNYENEYTLKDHLGSNRVVFRDKDNDRIIDTSDIKQINHTYPFGMDMEGNWNGSFAGSGTSGNSYKYNGKEFNNDYGLGWYHYGARFYDPAIGRFPSVDPIIEKFPHVTPYNYAESSPVSNIDLWGLQKYHFTRLKEKDGSTYLRLNGVSDILKTEHYIDTRLGILGLWKVRTTVDNTRQEYEVSQTDNSYGISVTKTKAYNTLEDAAKAPDSDFKVSSVEKFMNGFEQNAELGLTVLYRGGGLFNIRNIDVAINKENGLVKITKGVSLNSDPKKVAQFGGAYKIESIPEELQIIQRGGPCHFEIVPKSEISLERFQELLNQVKTKKIE